MITMQVAALREKGVGVVEVNIFLGGVVLIDVLLSAGLEIVRKYSVMRH